MQMYWREGLRNLYYYKLRSLLSLLGILVGTASVVGMVLGGEIVSNQVLKQFKSLGTDLLAVFITKSSTEEKDSTESEKLSITAALAISKQHAEIKNVAPYTYLYNSLSYRGEVLEGGTVIGVTDEFAQITKIYLQSGRFISLFDGYQPFCVIGHALYEKLKTISYHEPIGSQLRINNQLFEIIGVARPWPGSGFIYTNIDRAVMIPIASSFSLSKSIAISNILLRLTSDADIAGVKQKVSAYLKKQIPHMQADFHSAKELIDHLEKQSAILTILLGVIGGISLLVGGIGVMNIMLVSVIERRREIGIRLAVGARPRDIAILFLVEALILSLTGGFLGVLFGIVIAYGIAIYWQWEFIFLWWPPTIGFLVALGVGVFFGSYPALKASHLTPIEALRAN